MKSYCTRSTFFLVLLALMMVVYPVGLSSSDAVESVFDSSAGANPSQVVWDQKTVGMKSEPKSNRMVFSLPLDEAQYYEMINAELKFLQRNEDRSFVFINAARDIEYSDEDYTVYGNFTDLALFVFDENGNRLTESLEWQWAGSNTLLIPSELAIPGEDGQDPPLREAMIYASLDTESGSITPEQILFWDDNTQFWAANHEISFQDGLGIRLHHLERIKTTDQQGGILPCEDWTVAADQTWTGTTGTGWIFRMMSWPEDYDRFALFEIQSSDGRWHSFLSDNIDYWPEKGEQYALPDSLSEYYDDLNLLTIQNVSPSIRSNSLCISAAIRNISDRETIVTMNHLFINEKPYEGFAECYGYGPNWGLLPQEEQMIGPVSVPLDALQGEDTIISITFDLVVEDASDGTCMATIPVILSMVWDI